MTLHAYRKVAGVAVPAPIGSTTPAAVVGALGTATTEQKAAAAEALIPGAARDGIVSLDTQDSAWKAGSAAIHINSRSVSVERYLSRADMAACVARDAQYEVTSKLQDMVNDICVSNGKSVELFDGVFNISSPLVVPQSTGWDIKGRTRGGSKIVQKTGNTPIIRLTGATMHSFAIRNVALSAASAQAVANTGSVAIYIDNPDHGNVFNFQLEGLSFYNVCRGLAINPARDQSAVWGAWMRHLIWGGSCSGSFLKLECAGVIGQPMIILRDSYIDCSASAEHVIRISAGDVVALDGVEFNNGNFSTFNQLSLNGCKGVTLINTKAEFLTLPASGTLWDCPGSDVTAINTRAHTITAGAGAKVFQANSGGSLSILGFGGSSSGGDSVVYFADEIGIVSGVKVSGTMRSNPRDILGNVPTARLNTDSMSSDRIDLVGDAGGSLTTNSARVQRFNATLTANRTLNLPSTGLRIGQEFEIVRDAATPGAFTLTVNDNLSAVNHVFAADTKGWVRYKAVSTGAWMKLGSGTL